MGTDAANASELDKVEVKSFATRNFRLGSGEILPELKLVYETYGILAPNRRNAILITHGYTSSQHAAGRSIEGEVGWWDGLIGPAKAFDTGKYFVVSSNMLGSSFGSTGPGSINPKTGKPYGPDFPAYTVADMVAAQQAMLESLGVKHLVAVAGPSYGGYQAFQWGVSYPDAMDGIVAVVTAPKAVDGERMVAGLRARFAKAPGWNGGRYYENNSMLEFMTDVRVATLKQYGIEANLMAQYPDSSAREAAIRRTAADWAKLFDPNSMLVLAQARAHFDTEKDFAKMSAKVLYVLSRSDAIFPPSLAPQVMAALKAANVDATYFELDSDHGQLASNVDWAKWAPTLKAFLTRLGS
jgi:homoserine O-acetyltransferase